MISLGISSSRSKDLYDLFVLIKLKVHEINLIQLKLAIDNTFSYRGTLFDLDRIIDIINEISSSEIQKDMWNRYTKSNYFANNISFKEIIDSIFTLVDKL